MRQFTLTPAMGKRLIGKAVAARDDIRRTLAEGTLVIVAGTTNGYVAEEVLAALGQAEGFSRVGFRRGATVAPGAALSEVEFPGDVVISGGKWQRGKTIFDVVDDLQAGDIVLKGANALDPGGQAALLIGHPKAGTIHAALSAVYGRRVQLLVPVGLEKRIFTLVAAVARCVNAPEASGPRFYPLPGEVVTELDAMEALTGARAELTAGGGICGAEGAIWVAVTGSAQEEQAAAQLVESVSGEPLCEA